MALLDRDCDLETPAVVPEVQLWIVRGERVIDAKVKRARSRGRRRQLADRYGRRLASSRQHC